MAHVAVGDTQALGELAGAQRPTALVLLIGLPELGDPLGGGRRAGAQLGELLADLPLVAAELPGELPGLQPVMAANLAGPVVAFHLGRQPLRIGRVAGDAGLLMAAGGEMRLQPGQLPRGRPAVADRPGEHLQTVAAGVLGAQPGQPLAGHRRCGADLDGQLVGVKASVTGQLPAQVGVGDPVPHQPPPQLPQGGVAVALGP
jgi:hypothetical protein